MKRKQTYPANLFVSSCNFFCDQKIIQFKIYIPEYSSGYVQGAQNPCFLLQTHTQTYIALNALQKKTMCILKLTYKGMYIVIYRLFTRFCIISTPILICKFRHLFLDVQTQGNICFTILYFCGYNLKGKLLLHTLYVDFSFLASNVIQIFFKIYMVRGRFLMGFVVHVVESIIMLYDVIML